MAQQDTVRARFVVKRPIERACGNCWSSASWCLAVGHVVWLYVLTLSL